MLRSLIVALLGLVFLAPSAWLITDRAYAGNHGGQGNNNQGDNNQGDNNQGDNNHGNGGTAKVPEISPVGTAAMATLLVGGTALLMSARRQSKQRN